VAGNSTIHYARVPSASDFDLFAYLVFSHLHT